ncbi:MAG TPA: tyrosine-protein phosphatase [Tepidisphaeraceae bacterium]|jgi:protein tyrosine phosphatase (PTP) superfamily phosphohydrolase (DUF442 family)|nr:tyrosine-protein phosphatase [Tepidisphaeraceae bacterium]
MISTILIILVIVAGAAFWYLRVQTYHLETVTDRVLYRDGNRGVREFATMVRKVQPKTVVTLIDEKELVDPRKPMFAHEAELLKRQNIDQVNLVVPLGGYPSTDDIQKFLAIVEDPAKQPVVVHCAQGVRRTGMMVAAYQESILGWDKEKVKNNMLTFGHSQRTVSDVKRFVDTYDPKSRTMMAELERGVE